jgi:hypothetical protein
MRSVLWALGASFLTVPDPNWDNVPNINARMADGVVGISQYNLASNWGSAIASVVLLY